MAARDALFGMLGYDSSQGRSRLVSETLLEWETKAIQDTQQRFLYHVTGVREYDLSWWCAYGDLEMLKAEGVEGVRCGAEGVGSVKRLMERTKGVMSI